MSFGDDQSWPVRFAPESDELLSSWALRISHTNVVRAEGMVSSVFKVGHPIWNRDIDRGDAPEVLARLGRCMDVPVEALIRSTLRSFEGLLADEVARSARTPGIIPLSVFHRTRRAAGLMFCPECLRASDGSYYRKQWRIAYFSACARHGCVLLERCPGCDAPLAPHRSDMRPGTHLGPSSTVHVCCWRCGLNFSEVHAVTAGAGETLLARCAEKALADGNFSLGEMIIRSPAFFLGVHALCLAAWRQLRGDARANTFEQEDIPTRSEILERVGDWLADWPEVFVRHARQNRFSASSIALSRRSLPFWLDIVVRERLLVKRAPILPDEAAAGVEQLERRYVPITLNNLRKVMGRSIDSRHLPDRLRTGVNNDDYEVLLAHIDHRVSIESGQNRLHLLADKVWIALVRVLGWTLKEISVVSASELRALAASGPEEDAWHAPHSEAELRTWLRWYMGRVRPLLTVEAPSPNAFVSRRPGQALTANGLSARFRRHLDDSFLRLRIVDASSLRVNRELPASHRPTQV